MCIAGAISTVLPLDWETMPIYRLGIVVTDEYGFERTSTLTISITDVCVAPVFQSTPYNTWVRQDVTASVVFLTPLAYIEELDQPDFTIISVTPWTATSLFSIDLKSKFSLHKGQVFLPRICIHTYSCVCVCVYVCVCECVCMNVYVRVSNIV